MSLFLAGAPPLQTSNIRSCRRNTNADRARGGRHCCRDVVDNSAERGRARCGGPATYDINRRPYVLLSYDVRINMLILFHFLQNGIEFIRNRSTKARFIFDIQITGRKHLNQFRAILTETALDP
ncbi:hypothetical protein EVAR_46588_1 [Eumeta japonica]|uniref:Uncharacterized protein n=1 Tax=Eumeta variegata TaxID=151549 RepID=A0A4C1WPX5_EUMVA|nr:hypothetical protein EVAR_46588_1 [Eumeta japonica]